MSTRDRYDSENRRRPPAAVGDDQSLAGDGPVRTCIGCRRRDSQARLVRMVADAAGRPRVDAHRREPGRGAWVHVEGKCVDTMMKKEALGRALKRNIVWPSSVMDAKSQFQNSLFSFGSVTSARRDVATARRNEEI